MNTPTPDQIIRSRRRSVALEIAPDARLIVRAPFSVSARSIQKIISEKKDWIERTQRIVEEKHRAVPVRMFREGEMFLYLGASYRLRVVDAVAPLRLDTELGELHLAERYRDRTREEILRWYKEEAFRVISERVRLLRARSEEERTFRDVRISGAEKRWASCSRGGRLRFSWRLVLAPLPVIDYVVAHEWAHLKEKSHAPAFWRRVEELYPPYRTHRRWLRENGHLHQL